MNEHMGLILDGLLYVACYLVLVVLTKLGVRVFHRGPQRGTWFTAAFCVFLVAAFKNLLDGRAGAYLPGMDPYAQMGVGAAATIVAGVCIVYWRYSISFLGSAATAVVLVVAMYASSFVLPMVADEVLPEGPRMAQFIDSAYSRTAQAREAAATFKTVNEAAPGVVAVALDALATLSSKEEFESLKTHFRGGVKFYADRKALMDAMTPEERAEYRKAMAEFMAEQGLANDRYSLSALKNASVDDVNNLVAFMKEMSAETRAAASDTKIAVRPPEESLQIFLRNIQGVSFSEEDHAAMAKFSKLFFAEGADRAIAQVRTELVTQKVNPQWAGTFLAAALESTSGLSVSLMVDDPEVAALVDGADASASVAAAEPARPAAPRMLTIPTKFGYLRVSPACKYVGDLTAAAEALPVTGILSAGGDTARVRVAMGRNSVGLGETYKISRGAASYAFRMEEVANGMLYVTGTLLD